MDEHELDKSIHLDEEPRKKELAEFCKELWRSRVLDSSGLAPVLLRLCSLALCRLPRWLVPDCGESHRTEDYNVQAERPATDSNNFGRGTRPLWHSLEGTQVARTAVATKERWRSAHA